MDWLRDHLSETWLGLAVLLGVAEMFSLDLVLIMLAVGAIAGMALALVGAPIVLQVLVAAGASVAMLAVVRPSIAKRFHGGPELSLGHGKLVGTSRRRHRGDQRPADRPDHAGRRGLVGRAVRREPDHHAR